MISTVYQYITGTVEFLYSLIDKVSLIVSILIFVIGSSLDVLTTWYGYSNGLSEFSPLVRFLLVELGPLDGVIISKVIALILILVLASLSILYYILFEETDYKEVSIKMLRDLFVIAGAVYVGASINNLIVMFYYLL